MSDLEYLSSVLGGLAETWAARDPHGHSEDQVRARIEAYCDRCTQDQGAVRVLPQEVAHLGTILSTIAQIEYARLLLEVERARAEGADL